MVKPGFVSDGLITRGITCFTNDFFLLFKKIRHMYFTWEERFRNKKLCSYSKLLSILFAILISKLMLILISRWMFILKYFINLT